MTQIVNNNGAPVNPKTATVALAVAAKYGLKIHSVKMHPTQVAAWENNALTLSEVVLDANPPAGDVARMLTADRDITFCGFPVDRDLAMAEDEIEFLDFGKNIVLRIIGLGRPVYA